MRKSWWGFGQRKHTGGCPCEGPREAPKLDLRQLRTKVLSVHGPAKLHDAGVSGAQAGLFCHRLVSLGDGTLGRWGSRLLSSQRGPRTLGRATPIGTLWPCPWAFA